jgi:predicted alpha/beta-fold hydrolase
VSAPTLIVHAEDDPVVPVAPLQQAARSARVTVEVERAGGHVGFVRSVGQLWRGSAAVERAVAFFAANLRFGRRDG